MNADTSEPDGRFDALAERAAESACRFYPDWASKEGRREFDGGITDISPASINARARDLDASLALLHQVSDDHLTEERRFERRALLSSLRSEKFRLTELSVYRQNPMEALTHVDVSHYALRERRTGEESLQALTSALSKVADFLSDLNASLDAASVGAPVIKSAAEAYDGMADFYESELSTLPGRPSDASASRLFTTARREASRALRSTARRLREDIADAPSAFAIGATNLRWLLEHGEMVDLSIEELERAGERDLQRNVMRLRKIAAESSPRRDAGSLLRELRANRPTPLTLLAAAQRQLDDVRMFVTENDLVSLPAGEELQARALRVPVRWPLAILDAPGMYEDGDARASLAVAQAGDDWTEPQKAQWLADLNYPQLKMLAVREGYPGRYVRLLHDRRSNRRRSVANASQALVEGWAAYAVEMMSEQGYGWNDHAFQAAAVLGALRDDCRYLCAIRMHAQDMSVVEARRFFAQNAFLDDESAEREAERCAYDPMRMSAALGRKMMLRLREDARQAEGGGFILRRFHDRLLSFGAAPIPLAREAMLGERGAIL